MRPNETVTTTNITSGRLERSCSFLNFHLTFPWYEANWGTTVLLFINGLSSVTATVANFLVILAIFRHRLLHTPKNVFLFSLCLSDFFVGVISQPTFIASLLFGTVSDSQVSAFCVTWFLMQSVGSFGAGVSFLSLVAMSVDRYICVFYPLRYDSIVAQGRVVRVALTCWMFTISALILRFWMDEVSYVAFGLIPLSLISNTWIHLRILLLARDHQRQIKTATSHLHPGQNNNDGNNHSRTRTALTVTYLFVLFLLCYFPLVCCFISWQTVGLTVEVAATLGVSVTLVYINSSLNPAFYCWRTPEVWRAVRKMLKNNSTR